MEQYSCNVLYSLFWTASLNYWPNKRSQILFAFIKLGQSVSLPKIHVMETFLRQRTLEDMPTASVLLFCFWKKEVKNMAHIVFSVFHSVSFRLCNCITDCSFSLCALLRQASHRWWNWRSAHQAGWDLEHRGSRRGKWKGRWRRRGPSCKSKNFPFRRL